MKNQLAKRAAALAVAAVFALCGTIVAPFDANEAEAASTTGKFKQELSVINKTTDGDVAGIAIPDIVVSYQLTPAYNTGVEASDTRYVSDVSLYPERQSAIASGDAYTQVYNFGITSQELEDGTLPDASSLVDIKKFFDDIPANAAVTPSISANPLITTNHGNNKIYGKAGAIYRYQLRMTGIYLGKVVDAATGNGILPNVRVSGATNLLTSGTSLVEIPTVTDLLCDIRVDENAEVAQIVLWDSEGNEKVSGFTGNGGIGYNVYNAEVSTDYVGVTERSVSATLSYEVSFTGLPGYLVPAANQSWIKATNSFTVSGATAETTSGANDATASFVGYLADSAKVVFKGLPYDDSRATQIQYSGKLNYGGATDRDTYTPSIFSAKNTTRITSAVNSMTAFNALSYRTDYDVNTDATNYTSVVANALSSGTTTSDNNVRFVVFDPNELVIAGVALRFLPGIIMVLAAGFGGVLMLRGRRRV